jgi:hypothetical protein
MMQSEKIADPTPAPTSDSLKGDESKDIDLSDNKKQVLSTVES